MESNLKHTKSKLNKMETIQEEDVEYKVYKVKPYLNSDRDPFGVTLNGKTKEFISAHQSLKELMKKGRNYSVDKGFLKVMDVTNNKAMAIAVIEVSSEGGAKGNVELKIYNPSVHKKKGATIEMRKMSGYDYVHVEILKNMITILLDGFIAGDDIEEVLKKDPSVKPDRVVSKPKLFSCVLCNFQTRFGSALKAHNTRIHVNSQIPIKQSLHDSCVSESVPKQTQNVKRAKSSVNCKSCNSTFSTVDKLKEHEKNQHMKSDQLDSPDMISPSASPPRKKQESETIDSQAKESVEIMESENTTNEIDDSVEMLDLQIEANDTIYKMLENRIKQLEVEVEAKEKEIIELKSRSIGSKSTKSSSIPSHLFPVQEKHLPFLRGYRMRYKAEANGACAQSCTAVHIHEDEGESREVKKRINNHIADNWDEYYQYKIGLPYVETVGVGKDANTITKSTREEMLSFLRSDESLLVYTNHQELLATANLYNITINIFTFGGGGGGEGRWSEIPPDPKMVAAADAKIRKLIPDMALYHSDESHFDLLVKEDSRLALLGLLAGAVPDNLKDDAKTDAPKKNEWQTVKNKKATFRCDTEKEKIDEKLLVEDETSDEDLVEEITLVGMKNGGQKRVGPQENAENIIKMIACDICTSKFQSQVMLEKHKKNHVEKFECNKCPDTFDINASFNEHMKKEHRPDDWNCMDCAFQANCASELIKHLKLTSHQPSQHIKDKRKLFDDYRQCYTCKMDFDGYYNLMNHRKKVHPSSKKCRNFPLNCSFGSECWYVHIEQEKENEDSLDNFKCDFCDNEIKGRNNFMKHKKIFHPETIPICNLYKMNKCQRSENNCWFEHNVNKERSNPPEKPTEDPKPNTPRKYAKKQDFQEVLGNNPPPDQMNMVLELVTKLFTKIEDMELRFQTLMK